MYNLKNLNPIEFEEVCRDIAERMFNKTLRTFADGRDGGIDIADDAFKLIIQCKH
ncbi:MAG: restriction endonuclease, partial [Malacoplasma sp.]|nr:restriction endonuclease [Malacoplasma sp.]